MPTITFIEHNGTEHQLDAAEGTSAMQAAVNAGISSVLADCGGACSCATCHGYVDEAWVARLPEPTATEKDMIECTLDPQPNSRLTCQIKITPELDGLVVRLPKSQF